MSRALDTPRRDARIPIMLSESELAAIDDWRFSNRIATRAEAVRQLVALGLEKANEIASPACATGQPPVGCVSPKLRGSTHEFAEADFVVTTQGQVLKSRDDEIKIVVVDHLTGECAS